MGGIIMIYNIIFIIMFSIVIIENHSGCVMLGKRELMKSAARSPACRCRGAAVFISQSVERAAVARS